MGGVSWKDESQEIIKPTSTTWFKMEDACNLYNVIEIFCWKKCNQDRRKRAFSSFQTPNGIGIIM
jgi:hypothetical protein